MPEKILQDAGKGGDKGVELLRDVQRKRRCLISPHVNTNTAHLNLK